MAILILALMAMAIVAAGFEHVLRLGQVGPTAAWEQSLARSVWERDSRDIVALESVSSAAAGDCGHEMRRDWRCHAQDGGVWVQGEWARAFQKDVSWGVFWAVEGIVALTCLTQVKIDAVCTRPAHPADWRLAASVAFHSNMLWNLPNIRRKVIRSESWTNDPPKWRIKVCLKRTSRHSVCWKFDLEKYVRNVVKRMIHFVPCFTQIT